MMIREDDSATRGSISLILRVGSYGSALLMAVGIVLTFLRASAGPQGPVALIPLRALPGELARANPLAVMQAGVLLLLLTPLLRVVIAGIAFLRQRDYLYTLVSLGVLVIILVSLALAAAR